MTRTRKNRVCSLFLTLVMVCNLFMVVPACAAAGDSGTESNVIAISTADDLIALSERDFSEISEDTIVLTKDIDMAGQSAISPIGGNLPFNGTFDGQGHVIRNLKIKGVQNTNKCTGLFGYVGRDGRIMQLGLHNVFVDGITNTGAIAGVLLGSVTECYVTGYIDGGRYTGGIAGMLHAGTIENCWVDATFITTRYGGGLFGGTDYLTQPNPGVETPLADWTGPIKDKAMVIRNNLVLGTNCCNNYASAFFGSMADKTQSSPLDAFEGNVSWMKAVSAASNDYYGPIYAWWAADREDNNPTIKNNVYWDGMTLMGNSVSGLENSGIMSGKAAAGDGAVAFVSFEDLGFQTRTTEELGKQATYEALGWDFTNTWKWDNDLGHPILKNVTSPKNEVKTIRISTVADFLAICDPDIFDELSNDNIILTDDIDMVGEESIAPIGGNYPFNGTFDGQGHAIKNLTIVGVSGTNKCTGLFGYVGTEGKITNLGLEGVSVTGWVNTGGIVGCLTGEVSECYVTGYVNGARYTGGVAGMLHGGTIENCWTDLEVRGTNKYCGGLIGGTRYETRYSDNSQTPSYWTPYTPLTFAVEDKAMVIRNNLVLGTVSSSSYAGGLLGDMANSKTTKLDVFEGNVVWAESVSDTNKYYDSFYGKWVAKRQIPNTIDYDNLYWKDMILSGANESVVQKGDSRSHADLQIKAVTADMLGNQDTYEALGWDFKNTWGWSETLGHPVLGGQTVPTDPDDLKKYPASLVTTYVDSTKTSRAFTWNTINSIEGTVVQAVAEDAYTDESDFTGSAVKTATGTFYELMDRTGETTGRNIHKVNLNGLEPGTTYYYRVGDGKYWSPVYSFTTEWEDADSFTFFSVTDTQNYYQNYKAVLDHATTNYPHGEFILHSGDVIQNNLSDDYDEVYRVTTNYVTNLPSMVTPGNHELNKDSKATTSGGIDPDPVKGIDNYNAHYQFPDNGPEGYGQTAYSFTYGDAYFAVLNSNISLYDGTFDNQIAWLKADMEANGNNKAWQIVSVHHGPYKYGGNNLMNDTAAGIEVEDAKALADAMEQLGIDLVIFGHDHTYRSCRPHKNGSTYYYSPGCSGEGTGSAGKPIYAAITITEDRLTVTSHRFDREDELESVTRTKDQPFAVIATAPTAADGLTYTGQAQALVTAGTATAGTMLYSLDGRTYSETIPTVANVGTYTVYYKAGGEDYIDTEPLTIEVTIAPKDLSSSNVVSDIPAQYYTGSAVEPTLTVMDGSSALTEGTDYTVAYSNNTAAGTATATVTFQGNYTGTATKTFPIVRRSSDNSSTTYLIEDKTASSEEGTVSIRPKRAERGSIVFITVNPDTGYALDKLTVADKNDNELKVTNKGNGKYSFTMPPSEVMVRVTFERTAPGLPFTDVKVSDWFYDAVEYIYADGIMSGTSQMTFAPDMVLSRGMVASVLYALEGKPTVYGGSSFDDVADGTWYTDAVAWAAKNGVVSGYGNGNYGPMDGVTREQLSMILWRYAQYKGTDVSVGEGTNILSYTDAFEISDWAYPGMQWACGAGVMSGYNSCLMPQKQVSRAEAAQMLMSMLQNAK